MRAATWTRILLLAMTLGAAALAPSCGGSNDNGGMTGGVVATFAAAEPNPGANEMTMQPGTVSGTTFNVRITATDVTDFFGAAFTVDLPANVGFVSLDSSQSFLRDGSFPTANLLFTATAPTGNKVIVAATRLNAGTYSGVNVTGTRDLVTLTLRVSATMSASAITFDTTTPLEVRNSVQPPLEGQLIPVTWSGGAVSASQ